MYGLFHVPFDSGRICRVDIADSFERSDIYYADKGRLHINDFLASQPRVVSLLALSNMGTCLRKIVVLCKIT